MGEGTVKGMFDTVPGRIRLSVQAAGPSTIELVVRSRAPNEQFHAIDLARFRFEPACEIGMPPPPAPEYASFDAIAGTWIWGTVPWNVAARLLETFMNDADVVLAE